MIDTHVHLSERFYNKLSIESLLENCKKSGVAKIILAASSIEESIENIRLAQKFNKITFPAVGIHPQLEDPENYTSMDEQINFLADLIKENKNIIAAVGETGLDNVGGRKDQEMLFRAQIELASKYELPLIVHARKAVDEVIGILKEYKNTKGVFHCYTGGKKRISKILDLGEGWYFGIDGNITYEEGLGDVVNHIPKDRLLLETDSPFLTPVPFRGQLNEPANVKYVYQKVTEIWKLELSETEKIIDGNAKRLFKLV